MKNGLVVIGLVLLVFGIFGCAYTFASEPTLIQEYKINKELYVGAGWPTKFIAESGNFIVIEGEARGPDGELVPINIHIDGESNIKISKDPNDFFYNVGRTPLMSPFRYSFKAPFTGEFEIMLEYWPKDLDKWPGKATVMANIEVYDESSKKTKMTIFGGIVVLGAILAIIGKLL